MRKILKSLTKSWGIKLFCLIIASILWVYIFLTQNSIAKFPSKITVKPINVAENLAPVFDTQSINIKISADAGVWSKLSSSSFTAYVDLSGYTAGTYELPVNVTSSVSGVTVVSKDPDRVMVTLEPIISKDVSVNQKIEGNLATGYVVGSTSFNPPKVKIRGQKSLVDSVSEVSAQIKLDSQKANFKQTFPLIAYDSSGNMVESVKIEPKEVEVSVVVVKGSNMKTVGIRPKIIGSPKDNFSVSSISVNPDTIDITGNGDIFSQTKTVQTEDINIDGLDQSKEFKVKVKLSEGLSLATSDQTITVTVNIQALDLSKTLNVSTFKLKNSSLNIDSISPNSISITVDYPIGAAEPTATDLSVLIDLSKATKNNDGTYNYTILSGDIQLPTGLTLGTFSGQVITIKTK